MLLVVDMQPADTTKSRAIFLMTSTIGMVSPVVVTTIFACVRKQIRRLRKAGSICAISVAVVSATR
jgi:hypothetical protein